MYRVSFLLTLDIPSHFMIMRFFIIVITLLSGILCKLPFELIETDIIMKLEKDVDKIKAFMVLNPFLQNSDRLALSSLLQYTSSKVCRSSLAFRLNLVLSKYGSCLIAVNRLVESNQITNFIRILTIDDRYKTYSKESELIRPLFEKLNNLQHLHISNLIYSEFFMASYSGVISNLKHLPLNLKSVTVNYLDLSYVMGEEFTDFLVARNQSLISLTLDKFSLPHGRDQVSVIYRIRYLQSLNSLSLVESTIALDQLAESLSYLNRLKSLTLNRIDLSFGSRHHHLTFLLQSISSLTHLTHLSLDSMSIMRFFRFTNSSFDTTNGLYGIGTLKHLQYLDLSRNYIYDLQRLMPNLGNLRNLKVFKFSDNMPNHIDGSHVTRWLHKVIVNNLVNLEQLDLSHNGFGRNTGLLLTLLPNNSKIYHLDVSRNGVGIFMNTRIWYDLYRLENLRSLNLSDNSMVHLVHLVPLPSYLSPKLEVLDFSSNQLIWLDKSRLHVFIQSLSHLKELYLDRNSLYFRVGLLAKHLSKFHRLEILSLRNNGLEKTCIIQLRKLFRAISNMPTLKELHVQKNNLSSRQIGYLASLLQSTDIRLYY